MIGCSRRQAGVTLVEMLLVMMIIAILAMIVTPRFLGVRTAGNEMRLRTTLDEMRSAIEQCRGDTGGHTPNLKDFTKEQAPGSVRVPPDGHPLHLIKQDWRGPYLNTADGKVPADPVTGKTNWDYNPNTGEVHSRSKLAASDGTAYANWCTGS